MQRTSTTAARFRPILAILGVVAATAASFLVHGYAIGLNNHEIQIPHLRQLLDPALYPGDPFMEAMRSYFTYFWPAVAWICERLAVERVFVVGHALVTAAQYAAILAIGARLFPDLPRAPWFGLFLVFFGRTGLGAESLNGFFFTHTTFAVALGLWAVWFALAGRFAAGLLLAGCVFNFQAMSSAYLLLMIGAAALPEFARARGSRGKIALGLLLYLAAAAPGIAWIRRASGLAAPEDFAELIRAFFPYHFFLSSFGLGQWLAAVALCGAWAICRRALPRRAPVERALHMCLALILFMAIAGLTTEVWPRPVLIKLHIFRASAFLGFLIFVLLGGLLAQLDARWRAAGRSALLAPSLLVFPALCSTPDPTGFMGPIVLASLAVAVAASLVASISSGARHRAATWTLAACLALPFAAMVRYRARTAPRGSFEGSKWTDVQRWARDHSRRDEVFLTPPFLSGFRVVSERPVVGEWRDGAALLWSTPYAEHWRGLALRLGDNLDPHAGQCFERWMRGWFAMNQQQIEALARDYGAGWIVTVRGQYEGQPWRGEPAYETGPFRVFRAPAR